MTFDLTEAIGSFAAVCTTSAFIPQVVHTLRTRDTAGISLNMYIVLNVGVAAWLLYGILLVKWPIIVANAITLTLTLSILTLKIQAVISQRER